MKLGYELTIEQSQKLVMTPELIQAIQILQFNSQELDNYVQEQVLANPVLEQKEPQRSEEDGRDSGESFEQDGSEFADAQAADAGLDWKEYIRNANYGGVNYDSGREKGSVEKDSNFERTVVNEVTLPEHLMFQYQFAAMSKGCRRVGKYIIESLDENGYMTSSVSEIARATGVSEAKVDEALDIIHGFEPAGVGARDLKECLTIQLKARNQFTGDVARIINDHLEDLAANRLSLIARELGSSVKQVQEIADMIKGLEPKPGRQFASEQKTRYVIPDVLVEKVDGEYVVTINEFSVPHLTVSSYYKGLLKESDTDRKLAEYLSDRVNAANWLIKSIEQRKQTIFNVVTAVVKYQKEFFDNGGKYLKVLTLKDVAEEVGIHESTVSRSISGKYLQCPRGVFEIKYFFSSGVSNQDGEGISSKSIKEFIKELVEQENPEKPLSDQKMVELLQNEGFNISRRTVAKYRDELGILSSSKRKRY
ncbi:MAG: RNA polymerase factor sigma-54 [Clostridia bacterium]|nr:RNA polymerase factor sigma-54 [Clostridia bacterium]